MLLPILIENYAYHRRSNYASFLILRKNATFQTGNFQWCVILQKLISYCCITWISWLQKWMLIVACHRWCIKLRHICDMAETSLVVRDGNGNCNCSPTFLFSIWGHPRIPRVSKNMDASCRRKSNNGKRTRKRTRPIHFECGNAIKIHNGIMFDLILIFACLRYLFYTSPCYRIAFIAFSDYASYF